MKRNQEAKPPRYRIIISALVLMVAVLGANAEGPEKRGIISIAVFGDYGVNSLNEQNVAEFVKSWGPDFIATTGDNSYQSTPIDDNIGQYYSDYIGDYKGVYGSGSLEGNRFFPSLGNHDYTDGGGSSAFFNYFTLPGNERYYDILRGPVHIFVIDSNPAGIGTPPAPGDGRSPTSMQAQWLKAELAKSSAPWKIVTMHHPPHSSAFHGSEIAMQWPFEDWGAAAVMAGHDHVFERIIRDDNKDGIDMPYFVTGLGGKSLYEFLSPVEGSQVRYNGDYGALLITASYSDIRFEFWAVEKGGRLIDSYSISARSTNWLPLFIGG